MKTYEMYKDNVAATINGVLYGDYSDSDIVKIAVFDGRVIKKINPITADSVYEWTLFNGTVGDLRRAVEKNGLMNYVRMLLV